MKKIITLALSVFCLSAFGHFRIKNDVNNVIIPRSNNDGLKTPPCGNIPKGNNPRVLNAGDEITIMWEETINHPGRYIVNFSFDGDQTFPIKLLEVVDEQDGPVNRGNPATHHQYQATIKVPDMNCENCTIQMIQSMEENPNNPRPYFSCSDITIVNASQPAPPPSNDPPAGGADDCLTMSKKVEVPKRIASYTTSRSPASQTETVDLNKLLNTQNPYCLIKKES